VTQQGPVLDYKKNLYNEGTKCAVYKRIYIK